MARPSRQKFGSLDDFYTQQNAGYGISGFERAQMPQAQATAARQGLGSVNQGFLGLSERGPTPSGRSSLDPERLVEKEMRVYNKQLNQQLSPFNQAGGGRSMPQRMASDSVMGAMQGGGPTRQRTQGQMVKSGQTSLATPVITGTVRNSGRGREFVHSIARVMS